MRGWGRYGDAVQERGANEVNRTLGRGSQNKTSPLLRSMPATVGQPDAPRGLSTHTAARACTAQARGARNVLVTLGERGSLLVTHDGQVIRQAR